MPEPIAAAMRFAHDRPGRFVALFILVNAAAWTLVPTLSHPNAPLDVIEGLTWGREWQWGYHKHPPLQAWLLEITAGLFGKRTVGFFLLSQIAVAATYGAVWLLARDIVGPRRAVVALLLQAGIYYFSFPTPEFNPNVLQMPFWALAILFCHRALHRGHPGWWVALGVVAALDVYTKYSALILLLILFAVIVLEPVGRRRLAGVGPWIGGAVAVLLLAPHLVWLVGSDFLPFHYAAARAGEAAGIGARLWAPLKFLLAQVADHAGLFILAGLLWLGLRRDGTGEGGEVAAFDRRYVLVVALAPVLLTVVVSWISGMGLRDMWGAPMFSVSGLLAVVLLGRLPSGRQLRPFAIGFVALFLLPLIAYGAANGFGADLRGKAKRGNFPGPAVGAALTEHWRAATGRPLTLVAGSTWLAGNVAFYSPDRPAVAIDGDRANSPYVSQAALDGDPLLLVWELRGDDATVPGGYRSRFPTLQVQPPLTFAWRGTTAPPPLSIGWAIRPGRE